MPAARPCRRWPAAIASLPPCLGTSLPASAHMAYPPQPMPMGVAPRPTPQANEAPRRSAAFPPWCGSPRGVGCCFEGFQPPHPPSPSRAPTAEQALFIPPSHVYAWFLLPPCPPISPPSPHPPSHQICPCPAPLSLRFVLWCLASVTLSLPGVAPCAGACAVAPAETGVTVQSSPAGCGRADRPHAECHGGHLKYAEAAYAQPGGQPNGGGAADVGAHCMVVCVCVYSPFICIETCNTGLCRGMRAGGKPTALVLLKPRSTRLIKAVLTHQPAACHHQQRLLMLLLRRSLRVHAAAARHQGRWWCHASLGAVRSIF